MNRFLSDGPLLSERRHGLIRAMFGLGDLLDSIMSELAYGSDLKVYVCLIRHELLFLFIILDNA